MLLYQQRFIYPNYDVSKWLPSLWLCFPVHTNSICDNDDVIRELKMVCGSCCTSLSACMQRWPWSPQLSQTQSSSTGSSVKWWTSLAAWFASLKCKSSKVLSQKPKNKIIVATLRVLVELKFDLYWAPHDLHSILLTRNNQQYIKFIYIFLYL